LFFTVNIVNQVDQLVKNSYRIIEFIALPSEILVPSKIYYYLVKPFDCYVVLFSQKVIYDTVKEPSDFRPIESKSLESATNIQGIGIYSNISSEIITTKSTLAIFHSQYLPHNILNIKFPHTLFPFSGDFTDDFSSSPNVP